MVRGAAKILSVTAFRGEALERGKTYSIPANLRPSLQNASNVFLSQQKCNVSPTDSP